jgi:hypothetical protein
VTWNWFENILDGLPDPDAFPPAAEVTSSAAEETMPFRVDCSSL